MVKKCHSLSEINFETKNHETLIVILTLPCNISQDIQDFSVFFATKIDVFTWNNWGKNKDKWAILVCKVAMTCMKSCSCRPDAFFPLIEHDFLEHEVLIMTKSALAW